MTIRVMPDNDLQLKHISPDSYHEIFGEQVSVRQSEPDVEGCGFRAGPPWTALNLTVFRKGQMVRAEDGTIGIVGGIAQEGGKTTEFVRVSGRLYHWSKLKHV